MAWTYLVESEESPSHLTSGSSPSPTVKTTDMLNPSYFLECLRVNYSKLRYGTMSELSRVSSSLRSIWFTEGFPAKTLALREMERAWKESEVAFSSNLSDSSKKHARLGCLSKMSQPFGLEVLRRLSGPLPIWGITVGGLAYLPQKLEPGIYGKGGSYLPTPTASEGGSNMGGAQGRTGKVRPSLGMMAKKNLWPTPTCQDAKNNGGPAQQIKRNSLPLNAAVGGSLNPQWVEWYMGYNLGWTELKPWATQWFRSKRGRRSKG